MISIIIPVKEINDYIREAMLHYADMDYEDYEILIFPDYESAETFPKTKIIPSGAVGPAEKRDMSLEYARGDLLAFIDDDAYPQRNWLKNAMRYFEDSQVGAVGGPAVTAPGDDIWQQASGKVYESFMCSGQYTYRYIPGKKQFVDDLPSVNLIVRREIFEQIGGYDSNFYPGEDTKLCLDIIKKTGKKILYAPDVAVCHHRRKMFKAHLKQATNYALHRGYFVKALPETSCKFTYFVPSLFVLGIIFGPVLCVLFPVLWWIYGGTLCLYAILLMSSIRRTRNVRVWLLAFIGIFMTHVGYGVCFIKGLCSSKLIR